MNMQTLRSTGMSRYLLGSSKTVPKPYCAPASWASVEALVNEGDWLIEKPATKIDWIMNAPYSQAENSRRCRNSFKKVVVENTVDPPKTQLR